MHRRPMMALLVLAGIATEPCVARAEAPNAEAAQALFDEGKALIAAGRASEACPKLEESQRLDPALGTLLNLADCHERTGKLGSAWTTFRKAALQARAEGHLDAAEVAEQRGRDLAAKLPKISIDVRAVGATPGLSVQRDGVPVDARDFGQPLPAEPGTHHVLVSAPGRKSWVGTVVLGETPETVRVDVPALADATAVPDAPSDRAAEPGAGGAQRRTALIVGGVGFAGVLVGSLYGVKSIARGDEADAFCDGARCREPEGVRLRDEARDAGTISTVAFAVGVAGLAGGAVLWFTAPSNAPGTEVGLGPLRFTLRARF